MAKGFEKSQARMRVVSMFGKDLVRRSGARCELCEANGVKLSVFEIPPVREEPDYEKCIFVCDTCREQVENPKWMKPDHWRCLNNTMWSEVPGVQVMSVRMLRRLAEYDWAADLLDQAMLDEEMEAWTNLEK